MTTSSIEENITATNTNTATNTIVDEDEEERGEATILADFDNNDDTTNHLSDIFIKFVFAMLGVGLLVPWNAFISANQYFEKRFCSSDTNGKVIVDFELWFGLIYNISAVSSLGLIIIGNSVKDYCLLNRTMQRRRNQTSIYNNSTTTNEEEYDEDNDDIINNNYDNNTSHNNNNHSFNDHDDDDPIENSTTYNNHNDHSFYMVMVPLTIYLIVFAMSDVLVLVPDIGPSTFYVITVVGLAGCGTCQAITTAGIVSVAGSFPSHVAISPFFSGQALGGVIVSIANFGTAILEDQSSFIAHHCKEEKEEEETTTTTTTDLETRPEGIRTTIQDMSVCSQYTEYDWAVFVYFLGGCLVLVCCLIGFSYISKYHKQNNHRNVDNDANDNIVEQLLRNRHQYEPVASITDIASVPDSSPRIGSEMNTRMEDRAATGIIDGPMSSSSSSSSHKRATTTVSQQRLPVKSDHRSTSTLRDDDDDDTDDTDHDENNNNTTTTTIVEDLQHRTENSGAVVFSAITGPASCVFLTFAVTLCLFPGWISRLRSSFECQSKLRLFNDLYTPFIFVLFNVGDLIGRLAADTITILRISNISSKLFIGAALRLTFIPLLLSCPTGGDTHLPLTLNSDLYSLLVQFAFAFTNGLLISCSFMLAPTLIPADNEVMQERSSEMMTFAVSFGLLSGSLLSFPFSEVVSKIQEAV